MVGRVRHEWWAETSETQEAGLTAHVLFEDGSVEDKWAYEVHNHKVHAAVAAALSRIHELHVQVIKGLVTESRVADVIQSCQCELQVLRLKDDLVRVFGQFVIEHYHQYLGFSRYFVVDPIVFYEVVMERVYAQCSCLRQRRRANS